MNFLLVVAHPDDEAIGAGATIKKLINKGHTVNVCFMCSEAKARNFRPDDEELKSDTMACLKYLGVSEVYEGCFPNIQMNTVPHLDLVQFIEKAIINSKAEIIITHHPADTNNDHHQTSIAAQAAMRLFQRRQDITQLKEMWFMEILSSTEWSVDSSINGFRPNVFVEVGEEGIESKIYALSLYRGVMRDFPHPRSNEAIKGLAAYRGAQSGTNYAESFECVFRRCCSDV
ncbi:MAG: PIG-L family deacetylase [Clostridia bacterium]|nr:PIG-L family deacetylase [Clostridia bacterium]